MRDACEQAREVARTSRKRVGSFAQRFRAAHMALNLLRHLVKCPGQIAELIGPVGQSGPRRQVACRDCGGFVGQRQNGLCEAPGQDVREPQPAEDDGQLQEDDEGLEPSERSVRFRRVDLDDQSPV